MPKTLTERVVTNVDRETRDWLETQATQTERSVGHVLRLAIRHYRATVKTRPKGSR